MERKIGEIFEFGGEWYQCVEGTCRNCSFYYDTVCKNITTIGNCYYSSRTDHKFVIFKKLEKVGEPFSCNYYGDSRLVMMQEYQLFDSNVIYYYQTPPMYITDYKHKRIAIEIKVNKEDMGERNDIRPYDELFSPGTVSNTKYLAKEDMEETKLNIKPFSLEAAKAGKPVCTRDGRKARIICFDYQTYDDFCMVVAFKIDRFENLMLCDLDGKCRGEGMENYDLMMLPEKKSGYAKIRKDINLYDTKEEADRKMIGNDEYVTAKVCWEE